MEGGWGAEERGAEESRGGGGERGEPKEREVDSLCGRPASGRPVTQNALIFPVLAGYL